MRFKSFIDTHNILNEHASLLLDTTNKLAKRDIRFNFIIECLLESNLFEANDEEEELKPMQNPGMADRFKSKKSRADKRRTYSDEEWQHASDIIRGNRDALKKKNKGKEPELFGRGYGIPTAMRHVLKVQEPAIAAWEKLGVDSNPQQVQMLMKSSGQPILPDPKYKDYLSIKYLNELKQKAVSGQRLLGREQQLMQQWQSLNNQTIQAGDKNLPRIAGKGLQGSNLLSTDQFYQMLKDQGVSVISDDEAELRYLELVQQDIISGRAHVEKPDVKFPARKFEKSIARWRGTNTFGADPEDVSIPNNLEAGKDLPDPYIGMGTDSTRAADEEVLRQYDMNPKLYATQIIKPACMGTASQLLAIWRRSGQEGNLPLSSKNLPNPLSSNPPCGLTGNEPAITKINAWLDPYGSSFHEILQHVIDELKNSTNMREKDGSPVFGEEVGADKENLRFLWAKLFAWHALQKVYRAMEREKRVRGDIQGAVGNGVTRGRAGSGTVNKTDNDAGSIGNDSEDGEGNASQNLAASGMSGTEKERIKNQFKQYLPQLQNIMKPADLEYFQELMDQLKQANKDQKNGVPGFRQARAEALEGLRDLIDAYPQIEDLLSKAIEAAAADKEEEEEPVA